VKFLTAGEGQRFLDSAESAARTEDLAETYQGTAYAAFVVMLMSGMRVGEVLGLKWADLDERTSTLRVQRAVTQDAHRRKVLGPTKTSRTRAIPLGPGRFGHSSYSGSGRPSGASSLATCTGIRG
jgi:integrase